MFLVVLIYSQRFLFQPLQEVKKGDLCVLQAMFVYFGQMQLGGKEPRST